MSSTRLQRRTRYQTRKDPKIVAKDPTQPRPNKVLVRMTFGSSLGRQNAVSLARTTGPLAMLALSVESATHEGLEGGACFGALQPSGKVLSFLFDARQDVPAVAPDEVSGDA